METKSIEQLENDVWENPSKFPSDMIERCYRYRKISIAELTKKQIKLLISQKIGIEYLVEIAIEKLEWDILTECEFYKGDLLMAIFNLPTKFWSENKADFLTFTRLVEQNSDLIKSELGENKLEYLKERIDNDIF
ncbi:MAG: contact-dependent growth inhibition system immunity protein [Bacteroidota bacterium]|nr:contact-dependent growth inhibition system immunity protein [Bacteroidota bacterium]